MNYKVTDGEQLRSRRCAVASATVIAAGALVAIDTGLIITAVAASTKVGYCRDGSADGETTCIVSTGNDFTLRGTMDVVFAVSYKGGEYDINDTAQTINVGASTLDILTVSIDEDAGVVGVATGVEVRINKPLF